MNDTNLDDFNIFATSKRIKKEEPVIALRSPLESQANTNWAKEGEREVALKSTPPINVEENLGNVGAELQKFRKYPTKTYDKLINKMVLFNSEEFHLIRDLASEISIARKRSSIQNKGSLPRITENTVIRAALSAIFSKIGKTNMDLTTLQTEEALENYFNTLLK